MQWNHPKTHYHAPNFDASVENSAEILQNLEIGLTTLEIKSWEIGSKETDRQENRNIVRKEIIILRITEIKELFKI